MQVRVLRFIFYPFGIIPLPTTINSIPLEMQREASKAFDIAEKLLEEIGIPLAFATITRYSWREEIIIDADSPREFTFEDAILFQEKLQKYFLIDHFEMTASYDDTEDNWKDSRPHFEIGFFNEYE